MMRLDTSKTSSSFLRSPHAWCEFGVLVALATATFLLYGNTFSVPWYFDDVNGILEWPGLHNLRLAFFNLLSSRGVAKFSFALNYYLGGIDPAGYHLVNTLVHAGSALFLYPILKRIFRGSSLAPILGTLLFAVHPLQTQAVTYVVQRSTCLAGFFFLLALYLYIKSREEEHQSSMLALGYMASAVIAGAMALFTKENSVVLPVVIFLFDRYFMGNHPGGLRQSLRRALPFAVVPILFTAFIYGMTLVSSKGLITLTGTDSTMVSLRHLTPLAYFVTQFCVIWTYMRLILAPYGLALDHAYPVAQKLFTLSHTVAGTGLLGLLCLAWGLRERAPRISFGIAWFFLTLAVESSFIPLDPLFEHRLYLPLIGFVIVILDLWGRLPGRKGALMLMVGVIVAFAVLTWQRNALWNDPVAFQEDNLHQAPNSERVRLALSQAYVGRQRYDEAVKILLEAIDLNPQYADLYNNLGSLYDIKGERDKAEEYLQRAIEINPRFGKAYCNRGVLYAGEGRWVEAEADYRTALQFSPDAPKTHYNLGVALFNLNRLVEARAEFDKTYTLAPDDGEAIYNLAVTSLKLGDHNSGPLLLPRLRVINRELADALARQLAEISQ